MKSILLILSLAFLNLHLFAQLPYTVSKYNFDSSLNIQYGTATDYAGNQTNLMMDIYKPLADSNCLRPVMILVHGGAWIGGSKDDYNMAYMSRELSKKGWVVANINYRLGTHKAANYSMYPLCNTTLSQPCGYISDSAEIYRANFRAMQDAKGAIRYMKSRHLIDSTDIDNVFIAGESAGGFAALAAAFTDTNSEKDSSCYAIANAPNPDADMSNYACVPSPLNLSRPDLGSIEGNLHTGTYNSKVKGVGNFYGGVLNTNIFNQATDTPLVYLFHQGSDVVVHYKHGTLLGRTSYECYGGTNICQPYYFYPQAFGSESIRLFFAGSIKPPVYKAEIISNYSYQNNCFSNGHAIDNINVRLQSMLDLFAVKILQSGNDPGTNCDKINIRSQLKSLNIGLWPNPADHTLQIEVPDLLSGSTFSLMTIDGQIVIGGILGTGLSGIDVSDLAGGIYILNIGNTIYRQIVIN